MSIVELVLARRLIAVVRLHDYEHAVETARALAAGGVTILEFTLTGQGAIAAVTATRQALGEAVVAGVGTVLKAEDAEAAIDAGAQFVVTPAVRLPVIAACVKHQTLCVADRHDRAIGARIWRRVVFLGLSPAHTVRGPRRVCMSCP